MSHGNGEKQEKDSRYEMGGHMELLKKVTREGFTEEVTFEH